MLPGSSVVIKDPLGVKHTYHGNGTDLATAEAALEAKIKVVVGVPVKASTTDVLLTEENDTIVFSADTVWGDLNIELQKANAGRTLTRNVRLNEAEHILNTNGAPDLTNNKLVLIQNNFEDGDGNSGFSLVKATWEKKFSNR